MANGIHNNLEMRQATGRRAGGKRYEAYLPDSPGHAKPIDLICYVGTKENCTAYLKYRRNDEPEFVPK